MATIFLKITKLLPNPFYVRSTCTKSWEFSYYLASNIYALNALNVACGKMGNKVNECVRSAMFLYAAEWIWQNESVHVAIHAHTTYFLILILIRMPHMDQLFLPYLQCHAQHHRITAPRKESHSLICNVWLYFTTCCKWHSMYKNYILSKRSSIFCTMLLSANHSSCVCDISVATQVLAIFNVLKRPYLLPTDNG